MKTLVIQAQLLVLTFVCMIAHAQKIEPLKIGDRVPNIVFEKMLFHNSTNGKLSDFKGRAIIIDQWFISCIPCVSAMPKLDSLQKEFASDLQILPVTFEKQSNVETFWKKNILVKGIRLPQVVQDTLVRKYFPAVNFPHQIWINKDGIVVGITDGQSLSKNNIIKLINNQQLGFELKQDELDARVRYSDEPSIMVRYKENKSKIINYTYFGTYRKEFNGMRRVQVDTISKFIRVTATNTPLFKMYDYAYANGSWEPRNLSSRFIRMDTKSVLGVIKSIKDTTSLFCYDMIYMGNDRSRFGKMMVADLDRFFGLKSHEEIQKVECYVISPNGAGFKYQQILDSSRERFHTIDLTNQKKVIANDSYVWFLGAALNDRTDNLILFENLETKRVNFATRWNLDDLIQMNLDLAKYDLKIEKTKRNSKVIILKND